MPTTATEETLKRFGFETSRVLMVFYFDESDRLTKYEVKNVYTSV